MTGGSPYEPPPGFAAYGGEGPPLAAPRRRGCGAVVVVALAVVVAGMLGVAGFIGRVVSDERAVAPAGGFTVGPEPLDEISVGPSPAGPSKRAAVPKPLRYTGTGTRTIKVGTVGDGEPTLLYLKARPAGQRLFVQEVRDSGVPGRTVVVDLAPYEGVVILDRDPTFQATRTLRIEASGPWVAEVRSSLGAPTFSGKVSGTGDAVYRYTGGAGVATLSGSAHVSVTTYRADGFPSRLMPAFNGRRTVKEWDAGPLLVEFDARGSWALSVRRT